MVVRLPALVIDFSTPLLCLCILLAWFSVCLCLVCVGGIKGILILSFFNLPKKLYKKTSVKLKQKCRDAVILSLLYTIHYLYLRFVKSDIVEKAT